MRDEADNASRFGASGEPYAGDVRGPASGSEQSREDSEERRFPRPVRAEEREAFAIVHTECEPADRHASAERSRQSLDLNGSTATGGCRRMRNTRRGLGGRDRV